MRSRRWLVLTLVTVAALFLVAQVLPIGPGADNPPVTGEPEWDSPRTRELVARACFDCHSNETEWPWYQRIAPASWLVEHDVAEAREHLNFSEWDRPQDHADDAAEEVEDGDMPLRRYLIVHPEARLSAAEREELARGLRATVADRADDAADRDEGAESQEHEHDHDHDHGRGRGRGRGGRG